MQKQITTVKLQKRTKKALDELKEGSESYDEVISTLILNVKRKSLKEQLIEGYKSIDAEDMKEFHEWEAVSTKID